MSGTHAKIESVGTPTYYFCSFSFGKISFGSFPQFTALLLPSQVTAVNIIYEKELKTMKKLFAHRGARTHDHKVKSLALYQLS